MTGGHTSSRPRSIRWAALAGVAGPAWLAGWLAGTQTRRAGGAARGGADVAALPRPAHRWRRPVSAAQGSTKDLYIWNDMNEPSVFNGPEVGGRGEACGTGLSAARKLRCRGGLPAARPTHHARRLPPPPCATPAAITPPPPDHHAQGQPARGRGGAPRRPQHLWVLLSYGHSRRPAVRLPAVLWPPPSPRRA